MDVLGGNESATVPQSSQPRLALPAACGIRDIEDDIDDESGWGELTARAPIVRWSIRPGARLARQRMIAPLSSACGEGRPGVRLILMV